MLASIKNSNKKTGKINIYQIEVKLNTILYKKTWL